MRFRYPSYVNHRNNLICLFISAALIIYLGYGIQYLFLVLIVSLTIAYFGSTQISSNYHLPAISNADITEKKISISFDDGFTDPENTNAILELLDHFKIKATFFCIGKNLTNNSQLELLKKADEQGHIIGNHSYSHHFLYDFFSSAAIKKDTIKADKLIYNNIGKSPRFYRPPYGITTPMIARAFKRLPHQMIGWSLRSLDTVIKQPDKLLERVQKKLKPGDILLFHDHTPYMSDFLPLFMEHILKEGYQVVPIDELIGQKPYQ